MDSIFAALKYKYMSKIYFFHNQDQFSVSKTCALLLWPRLCNLKRVQ
jgi:hypothetical protein